MSIETDIESLSKWQDGLMQMSQQLLLTDGFVASVAFVLTKLQNVNYEKMQELGLKAKYAENPKGEEVSPEDLLDKAHGQENVVFGLPIEMDNAEMLQFIQGHIISEEGRESFKSFLEDAQRVADELGLEEGERNFRLLRVLRKVMGIDVKDVQMYKLKKVLQATDAIAVVQVRDSYTMAEGVTEEEYRKATEEYGSLKDYPGSVEAIVGFMEGPGFHRIVSMPYYRKGGKKDEGPVERIGEMKTSLSRIDDEKDKVEGRLTHLLPFNERGQKRGQA